MKQLKNKNIIYYLILIIIALIMCIPLFQPGIHTGHDGDFHISRTLGTIEQLKQRKQPIYYFSFFKQFRLWLEFILSSCFYFY